YAGPAHQQTHQRRQAEGRSQLSPFSGLLFQLPPAPDSSGSGRFLWCRVRRGGTLREQPTSVPSIETYLRSIFLLISIKENYELNDPLADTPIRKPGWNRYYP